MPYKRVASKETTESSTREEVEKTSIGFLVYVDTQLFIDKGTTLTWKHIKDTFA